MSSMHENDFKMLKAALAIGFAYTSGRLSGGYAVDYANSL